MASGLLNRTYSSPPAFAAVVVAILTLLVAGAYTAERNRGVFSTAQMVLVPTAANPDIRIQELQTFTGSGVQGTFVEYLSSIKAPGATLEVRGVPASRVIDLKLSGAAHARALLNGVIGDALAGQSRTAEDWELRQLASPTREEASGPSSTVLFGAGALLALLAGLATFVGTRALLHTLKVGPGSGDEELEDEPELDVAPDAPVVGWARSEAEPRRSIAQVR